MKILQVIGGIAPAMGGTSQMVSEMCRSLAGEGLCVSLHVLAAFSGEQRAKYCIVSHEASAALPRLGMSSDMLRALRIAARESDICHAHGLWMMLTAYPAWAVRGTNCRMVVSPHGMLEPWALRNKWFRKKIAWHLWQAAALQQAACFHATAENECESVRRLGFRQPVSVIPSGVDVPEMSFSPRTPGAPRRLLFLSRLHPCKGLDILIKAWRRVQDCVPDWELHVVGPDAGGYGDTVQALARKLGAQRVFFPGPVYGPERTATFCQADVFVLPTHSENFGIAVAEALAHGVPAIVSKKAPWSGVESHRCGWWIDLGEQPLAECLRSVLTMPCEYLRECGARGREWMIRDFSWKRAGQMMRDTYEWLVHGGQAPDWVRLQ